MLMLVDPAALGGLAGLIAVTSWAVGRAHGPLADAGLPDRGERAGAGHPSAEPVAAAPPDTGLEASPCQQRALEERRAALTRPFALAELHAEASAIRRDERILGVVPCEDALIVLARTAPFTGCRFIGMSGEQTCPAATRLACPDGRACRAQGAHGVHHPMHDPA